MDADGPSRANGVGAGTRIVAAARERPVIALIVVTAVLLGGYVMIKPLLRGESAAAERPIQGILDGLVEGDPQAVLDNVSPYFGQGGLTRQRLGEYLPRVLENASIARAGFTVRQANISGTKATMRVHVRTHHSGVRRMQPASSDWTLNLERIEGRWFVRAAVPLEVNGGKVTGLWAVLGMGL